MNEMHKDAPERDEFERQLVEALRRVDAPVGFVARTMRRCGDAAPHRAAGGARRPWLPWLPARAWAGVALVILALGAAVGYQVRVRREQARIARLQTQFDAAMQVTSRALDQTRAQLSRRGVVIEE